MRQFKAILVDSYRELSSRKLFWLTLFITLSVVIAYASMGFTPTGISNFFGLWQIESEAFKQGSPWARTLYMAIFSEFLVGLWLTWIAAILALISTAGLFPELLSSGSIDLVLSKPLGRLRLFIYKYITGMLFVLLQVSIFCVGIFLCVGWRIGEWNPKILLAIPIVLLFFSYIYCVCVLAGVYTRSTIAALLLSLVFWTTVWGVETGEGVLNQFRHMFIVEMEGHQKQVVAFEKTRDFNSGDDLSKVSRRAAAERSLADLAETRKESEDILGTLTFWHTGFKWAGNILPRNSQTVGLLGRALKKEDGLSLLSIMQGEMPGSRSRASDRDPRGAEAARRVVAESESESWWWIIGTSLAFEAVILILAAWSFCRRDF